MFGIESFLCYIAHFVGFEVVIKGTQFLNQEVSLVVKSCRLVVRKFFFKIKKMVYYYVSFKQLDGACVSVKIMPQDHGFEHITYPDTWKGRLTTLSLRFSLGCLN